MWKLTLGPLAAVLIALAPAYAGEGARLAKLADDVQYAAPLAGHKALFSTSDQQLHVVDLESGSIQAWPCSWVPAEHGWEEYYVTNLMATPDGTRVVITWQLGGAQFTVHSAPFTFVANADGSHCAVIGQRHLGDDWGSSPQLTQDSRYLFDIELLANPPPAGMDRGAVLKWWQGPAGKLARHEEDERMLEGYDLTLRRPVPMPGFVNLPDGEPDPSPYGDYRVGINEVGPRYAEYAECYRLVNRRWVVAGRTKDDGPVSCDAGHWIAPQLKLIDTDAGQVVLRADGKRWPAPAGEWCVYSYLHDKRSVYSRDGGKSLEVGDINWRTGDVRGRHALPAPSQFPTQWDEDYQWLGLPESDGLLARDIETGELWLIWLP